MAKSSLHPAQRFAAPGSIQKGAPLKELVGQNLIALIAESLADVVPGFDRKRFTRDALQGLDSMELMGRALHVGHAMAAYLPADFEELAPLLIRSFGPPLASTEGNGLAPFFYLPHSQLIATYGPKRFESGMLANHELTRRFTAEFCIRPFLVQHRDRCLSMLAEWVRDENPHVRRLVSEGTRPRLPWAMRLAEFQADPKHALPLLEALKDDPELYVRRSVANHIGDIAKDHLDTALAVCERWLKDAAASRDPVRGARMEWLVRHAIRHPARSGHDGAQKLRTRAGGR